MQSAILTTDLEMKLLTPHPKKFTTETYHKMSELELFKEGDRLELIKGEIIEMSPSD